MSMPSTWDHGPYQQIFTVIRPDSEEHLESRDKNAVMRCARRWARKFKERVIVSVADVDENGYTRSIDNYAVVQAPKSKRYGKRRSSYGKRPR